MRILVSATLGGRSAGTWYAIETARRLAARGHEVLYLSRPGRSALEKARAAGLNTVDTIDLEDKSPRRAWHNLRRLAGLRRSWLPGVVLAHGAEDHLFWGIVKTMWARSLRLIRVRALDPKPPKRHVLSRWLHGRPTDAVVTANSRHYVSYQSRLHIPASRLRIIEAGIDPADFTDLGPEAFASNGVELPADKRLVVMVARFASIKGHRVLMAAASRIRREHANVHFVVVGYSHAYTTDDLRRRLVEWDLERMFTIIDRPLPSLPSLLARCHVGVIASVGSETLSRSLLEYLACGLPVVATDVGGIPDLLARGPFGRLIPPDGPEALSTAILEVLRDESERVACGRRGREYVLAHCTWDQRVDQWEKVLGEFARPERADSGVPHRGPPAV